MFRARTNAIALGNLSHRHEVVPVSLRHDSERNTMSRINRIATVFAVGGLAVSMTACSGAATTATTGASSANAATIACNVGITMPTRTLERWINDGDQLQTKL